MSQSQVLHTENFNVILDSTKRVKGSFIPSFRYRNVKQKFFEIENTADISFKVNRQAFTLANKLEYSRFGDEDILSGGFVYFENRNPLHQNVLLESYALILWQEIRGLRIKYSVGVNARVPLVVNSREGLFAGLGPSYEFERWTYSGTSDPSLIPPDPKPIEVEKIRANLYMNFKSKLSDEFTLDISGYYQPALGNFFSNYRLASSSEITYNFTRNIGLSLLYQNIYDPKPVVPISTLFHDVSVGLNLSF
ncbi:hypothetical protein GCM10011361_14580 [Muriicola marianensis]|uniref:DUF481 domain-containing protein n=1 Tax=Muriicola marianensis TaxID=1324801 RepID=A0ABQ1QXN5_9FLAO|nr:hypothetical protein GCM10011361_14580 [Muriicola marianensis]